MSNNPYAFLEFMRNSVQYFPHYDTPEVRRNWHRNCLAMLISFSDPADIRELLSDV